MSFRSKFRNDYNQRLTRSLFWENVKVLAHRDRLEAPAIYTLHSDVEGLINFQRVYVELGDPTGYKLSQLYLEDYNHWLMLMKCNWFRAAKDVWDAELNAKLEAQGLDAIKLLSDGIEGVAASVQLSAAKFLATRSKEGTKRTAGRPSKEEVAGELKNAAAAQSELDADLARIRLVKEN